MAQAQSECKKKKIDHYYCYIYHQRACALRDTCCLEKHFDQLRVRDARIASQTLHESALGTGRSDAKFHTFGSRKNDTAASFGWVYTSRGGILSFFIRLFASFVFRSVQKLAVTQANDVHVGHQHREAYRSVHGVKDRGRKIRTTVFTETVPGHQREKDR